MTKPETRIDYGRRIARVTEHIAETISMPNSMSSGSRRSRIFRPGISIASIARATGETAADTVRRLRLHRAAVELTP